MASNYGLGRIMMPPSPSAPRQFASPFETPQAVEPRVIANPPPPWLDPGPGPFPNNPPPPPGPVDSAYLPPGIWNAATQRLQQLEANGHTIRGVRDAWATMMADLNVAGNPGTPAFWATVYDNAGGQITDPTAVGQAYRDAWDQFTSPGNGQLAPDGRYYGWDWFNQSPQAGNQTVGNYWDPTTGTMQGRQMLTQPWSPPPNLFGKTPTDMSGWRFDWTTNNWTQEAPPAPTLPTGAEQSAVPLPWQLSPIIWNSLGVEGQGLLQGAAEAAGWDWNEYVSRMKAAWPMGQAPTRGLTTWGNLTRY